MGPQPAHLGPGSYQEKTLLPVRSSLMRAGLGQWNTGRIPALSHLLTTCLCAKTTCTTSCVSPRGEKRRVWWGVRGWRGDGSPEAATEVSHLVQQLSGLKMPSAGVRHFL